MKVRLVKEGASLNLSFAKAWLPQMKVWCVRLKESGRVVAFVAGEIAQVAGDNASISRFEGLPLSEYTVHPMYLRDGEAHFGPECAWPQEEVQGA